MTIFFTGDEHYDHFNAIKQNNRPFSTSDEMNHALITNHNEVVSDGDKVFHVGDFTLKRGNGGNSFAKHIISQLNGEHVFVRGSHDYWAKKLNLPYMIEMIHDGQFMVLCHYAGRTWPRSHYNTWNLHGHSHGKLDPIGKQYDVGVDNNNLYPIEFVAVKEIMDNSPDNFNYKPGTQWVETKKQHIHLN